MKSVLTLMAGAMFLSSAFASDPGFEERFKMKTGRYTAAEEGRREKANTGEKQAEAKPGMSCEKHGCCSPAKQAAVSAAR